MSLPSRTLRLQRLAGALLALVLASVAGAAGAQAQTGRIVGTVSDEGGRPVPQAQVSVVGGRGAVSDNAGHYQIAGVPVGTYRVEVRRIGFRAGAVEGVVVRDGEETRADVTLAAAATSLSSVVVSASRQAEKITDAPVTITRVDARTIENTVGNSFSGALKEVKGIDYIQVGVTTAAINARGFNSSFNNRMLMMEDGRIAVLPENGLPVGQFTPIPKIDLAGLEVIVGPGAALYGADASNGVLTLQSKDARDYPGNSIEVTGGGRNYIDLQGRTAGVANDWGYKLAAEYQDALDFEMPLSYPGVAYQPTADWHSRVARGYGGVTRYFADSRVEVTGGYSRSNGVGQTNVGHNQLDGWTYSTLQARYASPHWYLNAYRTESKSGDSYALNRYASAKVANPSASDEQLRKMSDWPSDGQLYAGELQNNFALPALLGTKVIWGAQYRYDHISSDQEWLTDALTGKPLTVSQYGAYAQTETPLGAMFRVILAGRYDKHDDYDAQFSPKAGLVFKPAEDQTFRVTYNRAFKSPTTLQTHFYIIDFVPYLDVMGNREGFTVKNANTGATVATIDPLQPETNQTWELGYKGILAQRLYVDVTGYYARYEHFLGSLKGINNPFSTTAPTVAYDAQGQVIRSNQAGNPAAIVYTYRNLGSAKVRGTDVGLKYLATEHMDVSGTFSWIKLSDVEKNPADLEATSLNSPSVTWATGADWHDLGNFLGGFTVRHTTKYYFFSGINKGDIPTFTTLDFNLGYKLPAFGMPGEAALNLAVNNLYSCRGAYTAGQMTYVTERDRQCGFGQKHVEMVNMPEVGTMVFLGVRYNL